MSSEITRAQNKQYDLYRLILEQLSILNSNISGSQIILTNEITGVKTRIIATATGYRIDITLTELGFDGVESTDNGVTGDWVTTTGA